MFRSFIFVILLHVTLANCSSVKSNFSENIILNSLGNIKVLNNNDYLSNIVKINLENSIMIYQSDFSNEKFLLSFKLNNSIDGSLLTTSIRRVIIEVDYELYDVANQKIVLSGKFSRKTSLGPIKSLFSREQSERKAEERLGIAIANDIKIRLIEWSIKQ